MSEFSLHLGQVFARITSEVVLWHRLNFGVSLTAVELQSSLMLRLVDSDL